MSIEHGGRTQLNSAEARANFQAELLQAAMGQSLWDGVAKIQAQRQIEALRPVYEKGIEARREWVALYKGGMTSGLNKTDLGRYNRLVTRYGTPTKADIHIDSALTALLSTYGQGQMIADAVMPLYSVSRRSGKVFQDEQDTIQVGDEFSERAPGAAAPESHWSMAAQKTFNIVNYARKKTVPDELQDEADEPIRVMEKTARNIRDRVAMGREIRVAGLLQTATNFDAANRIAAPTTKWDASNSDNEHRDDIQTACKKVADSVGEFPTDVILNKDVAFALINKDDFRDRVKYTQSAMPQALLALLADYLMVQRAHVPMARKRTSNPGQSTKTYSDVWSDDVVFLFLESPSTVYRGFGLSPSTDPGTATSYRHPEEDRRSDVVGWEQQVDELILQPAAGAHLADVLA